MNPETVTSIFMNRVSNNSIESLIKLFAELENSKNVQSYIKTEINKRTYIDWPDISSYEKLSEAFIREFKDKVDWKVISDRQELTEDFIREFKDKVDWRVISECQELSKNFIREFQDKVDWSNISRYQKLSEDFIREFQDKVDWPTISFKQKISEDFIREFMDKVNWIEISFRQTLSETFIREFKDKVDWEAISEFQCLSENFIREFSDRISVTGLEDNVYVSEIIKLKVIEVSNGYTIFTTDDECTICYINVKDNMVKTECNHVFCESCIKVWILQNDTCPMCRSLIKEMCLYLCQ